MKIKFEKRDWRNMFDLVWIVIFGLYITAFFVVGAFTAAAIMLGLMFWVARVEE